MGRMAIVARRLATCACLFFAALIAASACSSRSTTEGSLVAEQTASQSEAVLASGGLNSLNLQLQVSKNACAGNVAQDYFNVSNSDTTTVPASSVSIKYWI